MSGREVVDAAGIHHPYAVVESLADLRRSQCGNLCGAGLGGIAGRGLHRRLCTRRVRWWCWVGRGEGGGGQTQRPGCAQGGGERPGGIAAISLVTAALAIGERPKAFRHRQEAAAQLRTEIRLTLRKDTTARSQRLGGASTRAIKCGVFGVFGMAERGEAEQSVDRGQAGVAAPNPVAAFVFEVV
jgi:hypothetical protein